MVSNSKTSISIRDSREKLWNQDFQKWKDEHGHTNIKVRLFASETERDRLIHRLRDERRSHGETIEKLMQILETAGKMEFENHRHPPEDIIFSTSPSHELAASLASARAMIGEMQRQTVRWKQCGHANLLSSSSTETKEAGTIVKTLTKEIASHVASDAKRQIQVRVLRDEIATYKISMKELRDVVTKLQQESDNVDIERELWCRVMESNFREIATRKQLRDASCVEIELRERIARLKNLHEESFDSNTKQQGLLDAYLEVKQELVKAKCELNLEKKKSREHLTRVSQDNERDMKAVLRWLQQSKLEAKKKSQREEKILDRVKRAEQVADTVPKRIVAAEHRIRKILERDRSDTNRVKKELESMTKRLGQEQSRCKEMEIQYVVCEVISVIICSSFFFFPRKHSGMSRQK